MTDFLPGDQPSVGLDYAQQYQQEHDQQARDIHEHTWNYHCTICRRACQEAFCDICGTVARWRND